MLPTAADVHANGAAAWVRGGGCYRACLDATGSGWFRIEASGLAKPLAGEFDVAGGISNCSATAES